MRDTARTAIRLSLVLVAAALVSDSAGNAKLKSAKELAARSESVKSIGYLKFARTPPI
jgi:hypothetical protein